MDVNHRYSEIFDKVVEQCRRSGFQGYDPYDGCNTRYTPLLRFQSTRLALTYFNKFSPINFRPLLGIEPAKNLYARGLITSALLRRGVDEEWLAVVRHNISEILERSLIGRTGYHCWNGNGIFIQARNSHSTPDSPGIVGTEAITMALVDYYRQFPGEFDLRSVLTSVRDFCLNAFFFESGDAAFFRYRQTKPSYKCTLNASIKGASLVAQVNRVLGSREGEEAIKRSFRFLIELQRADGSWPYSIDLRTGKHREQLDFHQGFMLDGLKSYIDVFGMEPAVLRAYSKGLAFFRDVQFLPNGQCHYRYPRKWPANIHNQAQGIITFAAAEPLASGSRAFAHVIADWTLRNMYDGGASFHFLRYPGFSNKIPYLRWSQAWMLNALSGLLAGENLLQLVDR